MLKLKYYKGDYEYDIDHPLHVFTKQTLPLTNEPKTHYACITHKQKAILKPSLMFQLDIVKNNVIKSTISVCYLYEIDDVRLTRNIPNNWFVSVFVGPDIKNSRTRDMEKELRNYTSNKICYE